MHGAGYGQRGGARLVNTVQGDVRQVVVVAVAFDLPRRQAAGVAVNCEGGTRKMVRGDINTFLVVAERERPEVGTKSLSVAAVYPQLPSAVLFYYSVLFSPPRNEEESDWPDSRMGLLRNYRTQLLA